MLSCYVQSIHPSTAHPLNQSLNQPTRQPVMHFLGMYVTADLGNTTRDLRPETNPCSLVQLYCEKANTSQHFTESSTRRQHTGHRFHFSMSQTQEPRSSTFSRIQRWRTTRKCTTSTTSTQRLPPISTTQRAGMTSARATSLLEYTVLDDTAVSL